MSLEERLKQKSKTPKEIWVINSEINIEDTQWVRLADVFAIVKEEKQKLQQIIEKYYPINREDNALKCLHKIIKDILKIEGA